MNTTSAPTLTPCPYCGGLHIGLCPTVKAIEYYPDGTTKRVEFKTPSDYAAAPNSPMNLPWTITCGPKEAS